MEENYQGENYPEGKSPETKNQTPKTNKYLRNRTLKILRMDYGQKNGNKNDSKKK